VIVEKSLSEKKHLEIKKFANKFLLFLCQTSYCSNLTANEQVPFDLRLSKETLTFRGLEKFRNSFYFKILVLM